MTILHQKSVLEKLKQDWKSLGAPATLVTPLWAGHDKTSGRGDNLYHNAS
jgi:hypothetical protein